jgi:hypothetical protein
MSANPPSEQRTEIVSCIRDVVMAPSVAGDKMAGSDGLWGVLRSPGLVHGNEPSVKTQGVHEPPTAVIGSPLPSHAAHRVSSIALHNVGSWP